MTHQDTPTRRRSTLLALGLSLGCLSVAMTAFVAVDLSRGVATGSTLWGAGTAFLFYTSALRVLREARR